MTRMTAMVRAVALAGVLMLSSGCGLNPHAAPPSSSTTASSTTASSGTGASTPEAPGSGTPSAPASDAVSTDQLSESTAPPSAADSNDTGALSDLAAAAERAAGAAESAGDAAPEAPSAPGRSSIGADAGWPQCPAGMGIEKKKSHGGPMPREDSAFVILGLTNGPGFTPNPCLASQVGWVRERSIPLGAYAVVSQPSAAQLARYGSDGPYPERSRIDRLRNAGHAQARYNLASMRSAGMLGGRTSVPGVWVDVEPVPDFDWGPDLAANAAVVEGSVRAYREAGLRVGVYSTPALWRRVVGDLRLDLPEWRAAGQTSEAEARSRCSSDWVIQGGAAVLGQWVEDNRDRNLVCPGQGGALRAWFG